MTQSGRSSPAAAPRVVKKRLADGTIKTYIYARHKHRHEPDPPDSIRALIAAWQRSPEWAALADATRATYTVYLRRLAMLGAVRAAAITRRDLLDLRDAIAVARGNGAASGFVRTASALFNWAVERDWLEHSPAARVRPLRGGHLPAWTMDDVRRAEAALPEALRRAMILALYTGQRRGDLVRLTWADYDGAAIRLRQQKTGRALTIPVHPALRAELERWRHDRRGITVLEDAAGRPWSPMQLSAQMRYHLDKIHGITPRLNIHGLRKLAAARLAEAGCTVHEIAAITGHTTLGMVALYTASAEQERLAAAAVVRLSRQSDNRRTTGQPKRITS